MTINEIEVRKLEKELHKESRLIKRMQKTRELIQKKEAELRESIINKKTRIHKLNQLIYN